MREEAPIIAVILMLLSRQAARTSTGFLTGWVAGIVVVTVVVMLLVGQAANTSAGKPSTVSSVLKPAFGLLLVALAARQWQHRPDEGLGRSRGGLTCKIHLAGEGGHRPLALLITPGQWGDSPQLTEACFVSAAAEARLEAGRDAERGALKPVSRLRDSPSVSPP